jgi:hypothetical protein
VTPKLFLDIIGWIGSIEVIVAYALISQQKIKGNSYIYQWLNLTGAIFLIANTVYYGAWPSAFINVVWVGIAMHALLKYQFPFGKK